MEKYFSKSVLWIAVLMLSASFQPAQLRLLPTSLKITVLDELGNPAKGTSVTLYETKADYRAEVNPVSSTEKADEKGLVVFKKLDARVYYVHAINGDKSNIGAGVLTSPLLEGRTNKVNTIIE